MNTQQSNKNIHVKFGLALLLLLICFCKPVFAQQSISNYYNDGYYNFKGLDKYIKKDFFTTNRTALGLTTDDEMQQKECYTDSTGMVHCRYQQVYKGISVIGATFQLHSREGVVLTANGNIAPNLDIDVSDPISESTALTAALNNISAVKYKWQDSVEEYDLKDLEQDSTATYYPKGTLVITDIRDTTDSITWKYAWSFPISTKRYMTSTELADTMTKLYMNDTSYVFDSLVSADYIAYVDAKNGDVLKVYDPSNYATYGTGHGLTYFDGWQYIGMWACDMCAKWRLRANKGLMIGTTTQAAPVNIQTWYLNQGPLNDDEWWDGSNSENKLGAVTAHYALEKAWSYFYQRHGVWSSDNNGRQVFVYAQRTPWDVGMYAKFLESHGKDGIYVAGFTHVNTSNVGLLPSDLDVLGHEYTHAFIYRNSQLNISANYSEAGALNEGFADIFGFLIKRWTRLSTPDYRIGESIGYPYPFTGIRYYDDPHNTLDYQNGAQPAKYLESTYWYTGGNDKTAWHRNAGVLTHWFYLVAHGGTYNGFTINSIGLDKADDISFVTMMWYLNTNSNYYNVRDQSIEVARSWWGECSREYNTVAKAWEAVGVRTAPSCKNFRIITGKKQVAKPDDLTTIDGKPSWFVEQTDNDLTLTNITYTWHLPAGWSGTYYNSDAKFELEDVSDDYDSKEISVIVNYTYSGNTYHDTLYAIQHFNDESLNKSIVNNQRNVRNGNIKIYPNPTHSKYVTIELPTNNVTLFVLYSLTGIKIKELTLSDTRTLVNLTDLPSGVYVAKFVNNTEQIVERIIVK